MERFAAAFLDERALEIRLLADHRSDLVAERTRQINRLRWHLVDLCPELEAEIPARQLDNARRLIASPVVFVAKSAPHALASPWSWWRASARSHARPMGCRGSCAR